MVLSKLVEHPHLPPVGPHGYCSLWNLNVMCGAVVLPTAPDFLVVCLLDYEIL
jgi:hypothetical protein